VKGYFDMSRKALGKGLEALIPMQANIASSPTTNTAPNEISVENIKANPFQPRHDFDPQELNDLAASIREKGIVQPVLVRPLKDGKYELVAGERRLRAAKLAGLAQVPVTIRELSDVESLEVALIENIQRADLNPMEEAKAFQQLMTQFSLTQDVMAKKVGKERSSVANTLRLLKLPESVQTMVQKNRLSEGHARALLSISDIQMMERLANKAIRESLSVREVERLAQGMKPENTISEKRPKKAEIKDPHTRKLEEDLRRKLGTQVKVLPRNAKKGKIEIEYYSLEDLERILAMIG
jgi:ParB family transcriptional regulator, chromosome partitioning protein